MRACPRTSASYARAGVERVLWAALLLAAGIALTGCSRGRLPEQDSYAGQLYVKRCGQCHVPYNPHGMTAAMWEMQMEAMQGRMRQAGVAPLGPDQRAAVLDYLRRNAGNQ